MVNRAPGSAPGKILLIYPPENNLIDTRMPAFLEHDVGASPPLGLLYLAAAVRQATNWQVEVMDAVAERLGYADIEQRLRQSRPDLVGISVMTHHLLDVLRLAALCKHINPALRVVVGGPHVHIYPEETMALANIDYAVVGEGETTLVELLRAWPEISPEIPGLWTRSAAGTVRAATARPYCDNLDALPFPDRQLLPWPEYYSALATTRPVTTMISSRGCPFRCTFCHRPQLGKEFRARSPENIAAEMLACQQLGIRHVIFYDDNFTVDRARVLALCEVLHHRQVSLTWDIRAHVTTVDHELLNALKCAGCQLICYGVEAGDDEVLARLRKGITVAQAEEAFRLTREAGLKTLAYFMFGCPGETRDQALRTIALAKRLRPDFCHFAILIPFPATALYEEGLQRGVFSGDYWRAFARHPQDGCHPEIWGENMTERELTGLLRRAYREFYLRPSYIIARMRAIGSLKAAAQHVRLGLRMLRP